MFDITHSAAIPRLAKSDRMLYAQPHDRRRTHPTRPEDRNGPLPRVRCRF